MVPLRRNLTILLLTCVVASGCRRPPTRTVAPPVNAPMPKPVPPPEVPLLAPRLQATLAVDGELSEPAWREAAHSGGFRDDVSGSLAVPHSELRIATDGQRLLLGLYAADEDIVAKTQKADAPDANDDLFHVHLSRVDDGTTYDLRVAANGVVRENGAATGEKPNLPHATCAVEMDGTLNDAHDDDEEWVAECLLPFAILGLRVGDTLAFDVRRCDTPKGVARRCASWKRRVQLQ